MENAAESKTGKLEAPRDGHLRVVSDEGLTIPGVSSGILPLDERLGGLEEGGVYLFAGPPGPAKMVAVLQFLHEGVSQGERGLLLSSSDPEGILEVSRAWGFDFGSAWREGTFDIVGFREDFEMRVLRSAEPHDALEELDTLVDPEISRIGVDPGSLFLEGGAKTLLGRAFLEWARRRRATVAVTLSVDSEDGLPSAAEWLVHAATGVFLVGKRPEGLHQISLQQAFPAVAGGDDPVSVILSPGKGLAAPDRFPARRRSDRPAGAADRVLLLSLVEAETSDLEVWVRDTFRADVAGAPLDAVAALRGGATFGSIVVHAPRKRIREAAQACRAMRPLTSAPIIVASDDALRSTDRVTFLEAGADDCLTGGIDFRELGARLRQAVRAGGKPAGQEGVMKAVPRDPIGGVAEPTVLAAEAARRSADPERSVFSLVHLESPSIAPEDLLKVLSGEIRADEGDLVSLGPRGCLILLNGARSGSVRAFLTRVRTGIEAPLGGDADLSEEVVMNPAERERVESMLTRFVASMARNPAPENPGGSSGPQR